MEIIVASSSFRRLAKVLCDCKIYNIIHKIPHETRRNLRVIIPFVDLLFFVNTKSIIRRPRSSEHDIFYGTRIPMIIKLYYTVRAMFGTGLLGGQGRNNIL